MPGDPEVLQVRSHTAFARHADAVLTDQLLTMVVAAVAARSTMCFRA
ncbi:MAG: hypothetical protein QM650_06405 [Microlunatus sp.]